MPFDNLGDLDQVFTTRGAQRRRRGATAHHAGQAAEDIVARRLRADNRTILSRRWRCREGEIDIVARDGDVLVFVEVKRRKTFAFEDPVGPAQWRRLEAAAHRYMMAAETGETPMRFDLALVDGSGHVELIENARA